LPKELSVLAKSAYGSATKEAGRECRE
jgi:hypothetical protein